MAASGPGDPAARKKSGAMPRLMADLANKSKGERELQAMYKTQMRDFDRYQQPVIDMMIDEASSTHLTDMGAAQVADLRGRVGGQITRQLATDNSKLLPSQQAAIERTTARKLGMTKGGVMRASSLAQLDYNSAARQNVMQMAESLQSKGVLGAAQVAKNDAERRARARAAKGSMMSQIGSIAGAAIGVFGGPMGMMAGASIGGAIGGGIGNS